MTNNKQKGIKKMELNEILESKMYVRENGTISFGTPKEYINPFIDIVEEKVVSWDVKIASPVTNKNIEDNTLNIAYPRVVIEARLGNPIIGFESVIGIIYALDTQRPVMKVYSGNNATACTNLTIFNSEYLFQQDLLGDYKEIYCKAEEFYNNKVKEQEEFVNIYNRLISTNLTRTELNDRIGNLLLKSHTTKLGTSPVVQASKLLMDNSSAYSVYKGNNFECTEWNIYNAVTQCLHKSEITEKATKTVALAKLFLN